MSDKHQRRMPQIREWLAAHPRAAEALLWVVEKYDAYRAWRYTCPSCGERQDVLIPHGAVCLNTDCKRCAIGVVNDR